MVYFVTIRATLEIFVTLFPRLHCFIVCERERSFRKTQAGLRTYLPSLLPTRKRLPRLLDTSVIAETELELQQRLIAERRRAAAFQAPFAYTGFSVPSTAELHSLPSITTVSEEDFRVGEEEDESLKRGEVIFGDN